jgi:hypothetical protein
MHASRSPAKPKPVLGLVPLPGPSTIRGPGEANFDPRAWGPGASFFPNHMAPKSAYAARPFEVPPTQPPASALGAKAAKGREAQPPPTVSFKLPTVKSPVVPPKPNKNAGLVSPPSSTALGEMQSPARPLAASTAPATEHVVHIDAKLASSPLTQMHPTPQFAAAPAVSKQSESADALQRRFTSVMGRIKSSLPQPDQQLQVQPPPPVSAPSPQAALAAAIQTALASDASMPYARLRLAELVNEFAEFPSALASEERAANSICRSSDHERSSFLADRWMPFVRTLRRLALAAHTAPFCESKVMKFLIDSNPSRYVG